MVEFIVFVFIGMWALYNIGKIEIKKQEALKELENKFLLGMAWSESYKFQVLEILKIVYNKAAESDEQYAKDYEKIVEMTEKKFEEFGNEWIKNMNEVLGHKTEYKNWKEATKYINEIVSRHKT